MKKILLGLLLAICMATPCLADGPQLKTADSETKAALKYIQTLPVEDQPFIRFFTTYAIPKERRQRAALTLSFIIHSLVGPASDIDKGNAGGYYPLARIEGDKFVAYRLVPGSDTLWWIDLREYNWTEQSWENVSEIDGYFVEPVVQHETNGLLRLIAGNAILRADWFIARAADTTHQSDRGFKTIYESLLYAQVNKPTNVNEWRKVWGLDIDRARKIGNEFGTLVTKSKTVALHNRMLFGYRTELGWLYETYDVLFQEGKRNFTENFFSFKGKPPTVDDAGEGITSNILDLQVYMLRDGKGNLINDANAGIARHINDVLGDVRVRVPHSCLDCHSAGLIPSENTLQEFIKSTGALKLPSKQDKLRVERVFLSDKFKESIEDNQRLFVRALKKVNGLTPEENAKNYLDLVTWYNQPVTLEQAAHECGVGILSFLEPFTTNEGINKAGGTLWNLTHNGESIPRDVWDSRGRDGIPGMFQQAMIKIHGLTTITFQKVYIINVARCNVYSGAKTLGTMTKGMQVNTKGNIINFNDKDWLEIDYNGEKGFLELANVKLEEIEK